MDRFYNLDDMNYIYLYHTNQFVVLPTYPDSIQDTMVANFTSQTPLMRSAPIYSYVNSGPRTMTITLNLHRDIMQDMNYNTSNLSLELGDDYVDTLIKQLQSIAVPRYQSSQKMVNPPLIALRLGNEIFIKGIVEGGVSVTYSGPRQENKKYTNIVIGFAVTEVDPYTADEIATVGSFRGMRIANTLERRLYKR